VLVWQLKVESGKALGQQAAIVSAFPDKVVVQLLAQLEGLNAGSYVRTVCVPST